jgi:ankyrin repeat protein
MERVKSLLVLGLTMGCAFANVFAMEDSKSADAPKDAAALAEILPPSTESNTFSHIIENESLFAKLPDELLVKIFAHCVENDLRGENHEGRLKGLQGAISRLCHLRRVNIKFASILTDETIGYVLRSLNISIYVNEINPDNGETLLHLFIRTEQYELAKILIKSGLVDINKPLIKPRSPKISRFFPVGSTPLHTTIKFNSLELVNLLIQHDADITAVTTSPISHLNNVTPLELARSKGDQAIINRIEKAYCELGLTIPSEATHDLQPPHFLVL